MSRSVLLNAMGIGVATMAVSCAAGSGSGRASESGTTTRRPNVIFVHTDSWDGGKQTLRIEVSNSVHLLTGTRAPRSIIRKPAVGFAAVWA